MITLEKQPIDTTRTSLWRSRWAAIGAAVAVSLGAGGVFVAQAAPGPLESTIVSVAPERILDTRDGNDIGLPGPFTSPAGQKLQVTGSIPTATGTKIVVPTGATGVLLNVTSVGSTASGFISVRPGDATGTPTTSSLNITAGVIVPNSVQVAMPTAGANAGKIDITYDAFGVAGRTTDVLIDVVGYTTNTGLQQLVATVALKANTTDVNAGLAAKADTTALPIARSVRLSNAAATDGTRKILVSVTINAPVAGIIQIVGSTLITNTTPQASVSCYLTTGSGVTINGGTAALADTNRRDFVAISEAGSCSTNGALPVGAGTHILNLVSGPVASTVNLDDTTLDVIFVPGGTVTVAESDPTSDGDVDEDAEEDLAP